MQAQEHMNEWFTGWPGGCPPFATTGPFGQPTGPGQRMPELVVCFDQHGSLLPGENTAGLPSAFLTNTLAQTSLQNNQSASDIVDAGGTVGKLYRYSPVVPTPHGKGNVGVVVIGESVQAQESE